MVQKFTEHLDTKINFQVIYKYRNHIIVKLFDKKKREIVKERIMKYLENNKIQYIFDCLFGHEIFNKNELVVLTIKNPKNPKEIIFKNQQLLAVNRNLTEKNEFRYIKSQNCLKSFSSQQQNNTKILLNVFDNSYISYISDSIKASNSSNNELSKTNVSLKSEKCLIVTNSEDISQQPSLSFYSKANCFDDIIKSEKKDPQNKNNILISSLNKNLKIPCHILDDIKEEIHQLINHTDADSPNNEMNKKMGKNALDNNQSKNTQDSISFMENKENIQLFGNINRNQINTLIFEKNSLSNGKNNFYQKKDNVSSKGHQPPFNNNSIPEFSSPPNKTHSTMKSGKKEQNLKLKGSLIKSYFFENFQSSKNAENNFQEEKADRTLKSEEFCTLDIGKIQEFANKFYNNLKKENKDNNVNLKNSKTANVTNINFQNNYIPQIAHKNHNYGNLERFPYHESHLSGNNNFHNNLGQYNPGHLNNFNSQYFLNFRSNPYPNAPSMNNYPKCFNKNIGVFNHSTYLNNKEYIHQMILSQYYFKSSVVKEKQFHDVQKKQMPFKYKMNDKYYNQFPENEQDFQKSPLTGKNLKSLQTNKISNSDNFFEDYNNMGYLESLDNILNFDDEKDYINKTNLENVDQTIDPISYHKNTDVTSSFPFMKNFSVQNDNIFGDSYIRNNNQNRNNISNLFYSYANQNVYPNFFGRNNENRLFNVNNQNYSKSFLSHFSENNESSQTHIIKDLSKSRLKNNSISSLNENSFPLKQMEVVPNTRSNKSFKSNIDILSKNSIYELENSKNLQVKKANSTYSSLKNSFDESEIKTPDVGLDDQLFLKPKNVKKNKKIKMGEIINFENLKKNEKVNQNIPIKINEIHPNYDTNNHRLKLSDILTFKNDICMQENVNNSGNKNSYKILYYQHFSGIKKRNTSDEERKKYVINSDEITTGKDFRTTLMIKNIPNNVTQIKLLEKINKYFQGTYNFFYLPIDFNKKLNAGYAFINFKNPKTIVKFCEQFEGKPWGFDHDTKKICYISYARIQGFKCISDHFKRSSIMKQVDEKIKPIILN